jgi:hypothetical protein
VAGGDLNIAQVNVSIHGDVAERSARLTAARGAAGGGWRHAGPSVAVFSLATRKRYTCPPRSRFCVNLLTGLDVNKMADIAERLR